MAITLEQLIDEGKVLKSQLESTPSKGFFGKLYRFVDNVRYETWKNRALRYLSDNFQGHRCISDFESAVSTFENYKSDTGFDRLMVIIELCDEIGHIKPIKESLSHNENLSTTPLISEPNNKVFIVHGHDHGTRAEVARFIDSLGLEAIILDEKANKGSTIIQQLHEHSDVGFGIVIYSPCDFGAAKGAKKNVQPRARQNVVFEHGFLIGRLGIERVCQLKVSNVETLGDIDGVIYTPKDSEGMWKYKIAKEMKVLKYKIDMDNIK